MFGSLRSRLIVTYTAIVVLTLAVISIALYLFLATRQGNFEAVRTDYEQRLWRYYDQQIADDSTLVMGANGPTLRQKRQLNRIVNATRLIRRQEVRILVLDDQRRVVHDTQLSAEAGSTQPAIRPAQSPLMVTISEVVPVMLPDDAEPATESSAKLVSGMLRTPDGVGWVFVGDPIRPGQYAILVAVRLPRQTQVVDALLADYGDILIAPLVQAALIGIGIAIFLSILITRSVSRPLQKVAEAATAVAEGDLGQRAPVQGPREVRIVAEAFNQMTNEVATTQQAQRDFLANVTHDLRTPLTSIQGFSQAIMDGVAADPASAQRAAQIIYDESGRLNRMVQDLLDLARVEAGRFNMTKHALRLHDLLRAVGERLSPKAAEKSVRMIVDVPTLPLIAGDGDRLVQVFTNLIDNGIKHTGTGGTITVQAATKDGGVLVKVRDTGEGIPGSDLPHIFERFYQVDKSRQRRQGAGLGLTISRQIVEAHGGKIGVESVEGLGTVFSVWLPALPEGQAVTPASGVRKRPTPPPDRLT